MKIGSDCSGSCNDCIISYGGGCLAGHGDDDFEQVTIYNLESLRKTILENQKKYTNSLIYARASERIARIDKKLEELRQK